MKRTVKFLGIGAVLLAVALILFDGLRKPSVVSTSELKLLKESLSHYTDSLESLDYAIRGAIVSNLSKKAIDSLKHNQEALWEDYALARKDIAMSLEQKASSSPIASVHSMIRNIGLLHIGAGLVFVVAFVFILLRAFGTSSQRAKTRKILAIKKKKLLTLREKAFRTPPKKKVPPEFKDAVKTLAEISGSVSAPNPASTPEPNSQVDFATPLNSENEIPDQKDKLEIELPAPGDLLQPNINTMGETRFIPVARSGQNQTTKKQELVDEVISFNAVSADQSEDEPQNELEPESEPDSAQPETKTQRWRRFQKEEDIKTSVIRLARRGRTPSEISKRLKLSQEEVALYIRSSGDYQFSK